MHTRFLLIFLGATLLPLGARAQTSGCLSDWSAARIIVKTEHLVTVEELTRLAPSKLGGQIVRTTLCEDKTGYVYKLIVRDSAGQHKAVVVNAKQPFP